MENYNQNEIPGGAPEIGVTPEPVPAPAPQPDFAPNAPQYGADPNSYAPAPEAPNAYNPNQNYDPNQGYNPNNGCNPNNGYNPNGYYYNTPAPYNQPMYQQPIRQPEKQPGSGLATASLVLGILSLVLFMFPFITSILAIIFGGVAKSKGNKSGMATAGLVCGIISLVLWILLIAIGVSAASYTISEAMPYLY